MLLPSPLYALFLQRGARLQGMEVTDFGDPLAEYEAMETAAALVDRSQLTKLRILGEDRARWLQGQVSNDLQQLRPGGSLRCLVCTPTGQIVADCSLWDLRSHILLLAPGPCRRALIERLERMLVTEDVTIQDVTERFALLTLVGPAVQENWAGEYPHAPTAAVRGPGLDVLVPNEGEEDFLMTLLDHARPVGTLAYRVRRIEDGIPLYGAEIDQRTLPQELGQDFVIEHVSFTKGCYPGQEVVARIQSRGHPNRELVGIRWHEDVTEGAEILHEGRVVGLVTSSCMSFALGQPISLSVVRRGVAVDGTKVRAGVAEGIVSELPFVKR